MKYPVVALVLAGGLASMLAGCSGGGVAVEDLRGGPLQTLARDQVSAVSLWRSWSAVMYQPVGAGPDLSQEELPDGFLRVYGTESDGALFEWFIDLTDQNRGSHGSIRWPDGTAFTQVCDPAIWGDNTSQEHFVNTYRDGTRLDVRVEAHYAAHTRSVWDGVLTPATGGQISFRLIRVDSEQDQLTATLADGSVLEMEVPVDGVFMPVFQSGAQGSYTSPAGETLSFSLAGQTHWDRWTCTAEDGMSGEFSLNSEMVGNGTLERQGAPVGSLRWDEQRGFIDLLGVGQQEVLPSAAARDFAASRWLRSVAALQPTPMY